ncbi:MAG: hypothetical protein AAGC92_14220 [Pseudomonadota bacterium]
MAIDWTKVLGGLAAGVGQGLVQQANVQREAALEKLRAERQFALAQMQNDFSATQADQQRDFTASENAKNRDARLQEVMAQIAARRAAAPVNAPANQIKPKDMATLTRQLLDERRKLATSNYLVPTPDGWDEDAEIARAQQDAMRMLGLAPAQPAPTQPLSSPPSAATPPEASVAPPAVAEPPPLPKGFRMIMPKTSAQTDREEGRLRPWEIRTQ